MNKQLDYDKLCDLFYEIAHLTTEHGSQNGIAVVYPKDIGECLAKVDPQWWELLMERYRLLNLDAER